MSLFQCSRLRSELSVSRDALSASEQKVSSLQTQLEAAHKELQAWQVRRSGGGAASADLKVCPVLLSVFLSA